MSPFEFGFGPFACRLFFLFPARHFGRFATILTVVTPRASPLFFDTFPPPSTCVLSRPQTQSNATNVSQHHSKQTKCESRQDVHRGSGCRTDSVSRAVLGYFPLCRRTAEPLDSGGSRGLKNKVKVLLRSHGNFIPPVLV